MEFDLSRVYTALDADELEVGSRCIFANNLDSLKCKVEEGTDIKPIVQILNDAYERRFKTDVDSEYPFAYLISEPDESEPEEKNWIVYLNRMHPEYIYLTACRSDLWEQVQKDYGAKGMLYSGTEKECEDWYTPRRHLADIIAQWEDGKEIQMYIENGYVSNRKGWVDVANPSFSPDSEYRVKPESLKWTDLKVGDVLKNKNTNETRMVTGIMPQSNSVCLANYYINDLDEWEKV